MLNIEILRATQFIVHCLSRARALFLFLSFTFAPSETITNSFQTWQYGKIQKKKFDSHNKKSTEIYMCDINSVLVFPVCMESVISCWEIDLVCFSNGTIWLTRITHGNYGFGLLTSPPHCRWFVQFNSIKFKLHHPKTEIIDTEIPTWQSNCDIDVLSVWLDFAEMN